MPGSVTRHISCHMTLPAGLCYTWRMKENGPEPGFVQAYRLFVVIRILFWFAVGPALVLFELAGNPNLSPDQASSQPLLRNLSLPSIIPLLAIEFLLLALLFLPKAPERLGRAFVPITLGLGLVPLLVGYARWPVENPLQSPFSMFFFVTAVLLAWEYKYRNVFIYVFALSVYEALVSTWPANVPWTVPVGWLVLQGVMMLLVGYVTATLASVQREQRSALAEAYERQAAANRRLQQYTATIEELTVSQERNRLARELHDTLAHSLSAVTVQLEAVRSLWSTNPDQARRILDQASDTARTGQVEARRALGALRASPLKDLGLPLAINDLAESAAERAGTALEVQLPDRMATNPSSSTEQGIYRIAQETLENIVRHAGARSIWVRLSEADHQICLVIEDDGLGIGSGAQPAAGDEAGDRFGIRGMRERSQLIGASIDISDRTGQGTRVELVVPVEEDADGPGLDL
jgi:signal transduction histidine kinase